MHERVFLLAGEVRQAEVGAQVVVVGDVGFARVDDDAVAVENDAEGPASALSGDPARKIGGAEM